jgi:hypothetical protein
MQFYVDSTDNLALHEHDQAATGSGKHHHAPSFSNVKSSDTYIHATEPGFS